MTLYPPDRTLCNRLVGHIECRSRCGWGGGVVRWWRRGGVQRKLAPARRVGRVRHVIGPQMGRRSPALARVRLMGLDPRSARCSWSWAAIHTTLRPRIPHIMADQDNATRAPESDAHEEHAPADAAVEHSVFPGDTRAQEGPSMGVSQRSLRVQRVCTGPQEHHRLTPHRTTARPTAPPQRVKRRLATSPNSVA